MCADSSRCKSDSRRRKAADRALTSIKYLLEYFFFRIFLFLIGFIRYPEGKDTWAERLGKWFFAIPSVRRRVMRNMEIAFADRPPEERLELGRRSVVNTAHLILEWVAARKDPERWAETYVDWEPSSREMLLAEEASGRGMLLVSAHLGNWEGLIHALTTLLSRPIHFIGAPIKNPFVHNLTFVHREDTGAHFILRGETGPDLMRAMRKGEHMCLGGDQSAGGRGLFIPFFGRPASTHKGPGALAQLSGANGFFVILLRKPGGRLIAHAISLGRIEKSAKMDKEDAILNFTMRWVDILEKYVRLYPEQYFWLHNRWKKLPEPDTVIHERVETGLMPIH